MTMLMLMADADVNDGDGNSRYLTVAGAHSAETRLNDTKKE